VGVEAALRALFSQFGISASELAVRHNLPEAAKDDMGVTPTEETEQRFELQ